MRGLPGLGLRASLPPRPPARPAAAPPHCYSCPRAHPPARPALPCPCPPLYRPRPRQGNLSEFVKAKPEAKAYYELSAATTRFKFPDPGFLDGIKGKSQSIVRLTSASYTYPGAAKPQVGRRAGGGVGLGGRGLVLGRIWVDWNWCCAGRDVATCMGGAAGIWGALTCE